MKPITLTATQEWFIQCAIDLKEAVLPLEALDDDIFEDDYGITKKELIKEILDLKEKIH